jgi:hypothetical protein
LHFSRGLTQEDEGITVGAAAASSCSLFINDQKLPRSENAKMKRFLEFSIARF